MANHIIVGHGRTCSTSSKPTPLAAWFSIKCAALLLVCARSSMKMNGVHAAQYTVGDTAGWNLGVDYNTWASQYSFKTGDSLVFSYGGIHSVVQVSEADYKACNAANAITTGTGGNTEVQLDKEQSYYFICGVSSHCSGGMQLAVKVGAASSSSSAPSTPSSSTTPSSSSTTTTTTPSSSSTDTPSSSTSSSTGDYSPAPPLPRLHTLALYTILITLYTFNILT